MSNDNKKPETVWDLANEYIASNPLVKSKNTIMLYQGAVIHFDKFLGRTGMITDLTDKQLTAYLRHREAAGAAEATWEREGNKLLCLWRWASEKGWVLPPTMRIKKHAPPTPNAWNPREIAALFKAAAQYRNTLLGCPTSVFFVALFHVLFETGERIDAVTQTRWSAVDLDGRWVTFRKETRKGRGKTKDNIQRISRKTADAIRELRQYTGPDAIRPQPVVLGQAPPVPEPIEEDPAIFGTCSRGILYYHMKAILALAGLDSDRRSMFHRFRRTHATFLYLAGGDATQSLGHSSDQTTRDHYLDPRYAHRGYGADLLNGGIVQVLRRMVRRVKIALGIW